MKVVLDVENTTIKRGGKLHLDPFEKTNELVMVGVICEGEEPQHFTFSHTEYDCTHEYSERRNRHLQAILDECDLLIAHNASHDLQWLWETGFKYEGAVWDTMLAEYVLQKSIKQSLSLEAVAERRQLQYQKQDILKQYLKDGYTVDQIPYEELKQYLYYDLLTTNALYKDQCRDLQSPANKDLDTVMQLTMETCVVLCKIYCTGFKVDLKELEKVRDEFIQEKTDLERGLKEQVSILMGDTPINLNSPEQLSWVIYSRKPIDKKLWSEKYDSRMKPDAYRKFVNSHSVPIRRTKAKKCSACDGTGSYFKKKKNGENFKKPSNCSVCEGEGYVLDKLDKLAGLKITAPTAAWHSANGFSVSKTNLEYLEDVVTKRGMEEAALFLSNMRRLSALDTYLSSFVDGIFNFTKSDSRLHVRLTQHMTATGRFSGRDPNMQNMPRGSTFPIKKVFVSRWDRGQIVEADFAQLEFRVAAFLSQDEVAIKEVTEGFDVHAYTAKIISEAGQPISRQDSKAHTFSPLYGATGYGRTAAEARYYEHFTEKYKGITKWHKELAKEVLTHRKITTPSGRQFCFPDVQRRANGTITNFTAVKNYPVQSFATADIVPTVLIAIYNRLNDEKLKSVLVNSVHDSVVIDVHPNEIESVLAIIKSINIDLHKIILDRFKIKMNVPLLLEAKIGYNWLEQKEVANV